MNLRWEHNLTRDKGFYRQAHFARTQRDHTEINVTRDTYDVDFIDHFRAGSKNLFSYGGTLHWSPSLAYPSELSPPGFLPHSGGARGDSLRGWDGLPPQLGSDGFDPGT